MAKQFGYGRAEKLKSRKRIDGLFSGGKSFSIYPLRVYYASAGEEPGGAETGFGVSKKHFKKAVDRNRIKRLMRESYRLQKEGLHAGLKMRQKKALLFFIYTGKTIAEFPELKLAMHQCLARLHQTLKIPNEEPS